MKARKYGIWIYFIIFQVLLSAFASVSVAQDGDEGSWLNLDRMMPYDSIPFQQVVEAFDYQQDMRETYGFVMAPQFNWVNIGPSNDYRNGRVVRVKYDPGDETGNTVYICAHNGGVWRSDNAQTTPSSSVVFNFKTMGLQIQSAGDVAIDPQNHNTIYYGTGGNVYCSEATNFYGIGVYRSTNKGDNWSSPLKTGLPMPLYTSTIVVNPNNRDIYLADGRKSGPYGYSGEAGLYKSTNGGDSWSKVVPTTGFEECYDVVVSNSGQYIYAVTKTGYWRSNNYGSTFYKPDPDAPSPTFNGRTQIAISKADNNYIYIVTDNMSNHTNYALVSTDGGSSFSSPVSLGSDYDCMTLDFFYVQASPHDPLVAYVGFGGIGNLLRTTNGGQSFHTVSGGGFDYNNFAFNPFNENQAMECNDQGLYISNNILASSVSWGSLNYSLSVRGNYRVATNPYDANDMVIGVTDAGFFKYRPDLGPARWNETNSCCDGTSMVHTKSPSVDAFIGGKGAYNNGLHYSTNGGSNFTYTAISTGYLDGNLDWMYPITEKPGAANYGTFFTPRRNSGTHSQIDINVSFNYGQSWTNNSTNTGINPFNSGDESFSPQWISVCDANTNIMYISTKRWLNNPSYLSQVWRTTNGGNQWQNLNITQNGIPNRVVSTVVADPLNQNIVYLTLSGFGTGHVFKSTNKGDSWIDISGGYPQEDHFWVPNNPVNYLIVRYVSATQKQLYIGSDLGVYVGYDPPLPGFIDGYHWNEIATGLPNTICLGLDYNLSSNKLRAALHGRGIWELQLTGPVYIAGNEVMASAGAGLDIADDIVITSGSTLSFPINSTIKLPAGKKIIVEDGGQIDISSGAAVTFTSQSGTWAGIEFQGNAYGTLRNCTFTNTSTPIIIDGTTTSLGSPNLIVIDSCTFSAPVEVSNRQDVTIEYCNFTYSSGTVPGVMGIICSGSDNALISNNSISSGSSISSTGISVVYGSDVVVQKNVINNMSVGISISNSSPYVFQNRVTNGTASSAVVGIGFDNSYSAFVKQNAVIGYQIGYKMYNSSPGMYMDSSYNTNTSGDSVNGVHAVYLSSPKLKPDDSGIELIWDGGKNNLKTMNKGNGIYMYNSSTPILDYGYNFIWGYDKYLIGDGPESMTYYARCNDWVDSPPNSGKFSLTNPGSVTYSPYGCTPPGGSGLSSNNDPMENELDIINSPESENPPVNIIRDYGHGIYDTIKVTSGTNELTTQDQKLYGEAVKQELTGNYELAITKFKSVIENYQDSAISINAMSKILDCHAEMNADTSAYSDLRSYYLTLIVNNSSDSAFVKAARELAAKTLVKKGDFAGAITEYESHISGNNDPHEVLCYELNIIETYMIMQEQEGDAPNFTGRITSLKPLNKKDGYKMLMEKLYGIKSQEQVTVIPNKYSLSQNYPNPFNPVTKISYSLPNSSKVSIVVYDLLGRLVKTLVNEFKDAGNYDVLFDGTGLASGVYFYRIESGSFTDSKKMVLVK